MYLVEWKLFLHFYYCRRSSYRWRLLLNIWKLWCNFICLLGSKIYFKSGHSNLGICLRFSGFCFHIYWTCINWKLFLPLFSCKQSFILLFLFFGNTADLTQDIFASWGWHLPLPVLQEFVSIFSGPVWTKSRFTPLFLELDTRLEIFSFYDMEFIMQKCLLLGSRIDFGISCSSLGNNLRFAGILFHIFLTCVNGKLFLLFSFCKHISATRFLVLRICQF